VRKGNEALLNNHPYLNQVLIWDKTKRKFPHLVSMAFRVRRQHYTHVINIHRFASSGFITWLSGAGYRAGFDKNPLSFCYTRKVKHVISEPYSTHFVHEVNRNQQLIEDITDSAPAMPALYPHTKDQEVAAAYAGKPYVCISPASVWHTKQFPATRWATLIQKLPENLHIFILGGPGDKPLGDEIVALSERANMTNLCGKMNYLQSVALMRGAQMNYTNDSAPLHFASAIDAPLTAVFCSTVPAFGFGPLRQQARVAEVGKLYCRPCGLHGRKTCPEGHFKCAMDIPDEQLLWWTSKTT